MASKSSETRIIGFYGYSDSGKTTLIEKAISRLTKQGYAVGAIKETDKHLHRDQKGKDTRRFSDAGASMVALASPAGVTVFSDSGIEISHLIGLMMHSCYLDLIIIEGAREPWIPKIRIGEIEERENTVWNYNKDFEDLIAIILEKGEPCIPFK